MPVCGRGRYGYMTAMLVAASLALAGFLLAGCGGDGQKAASSVPAEQGVEDVRQAAARVVNACQGTARASTTCAQQIRELETLVKGSRASPQIGTGGATLRACNDGADNDGDGLTDLGEDPGCSSGTDNDEVNAPPTTTAPTTTTAPGSTAACEDGRDNDGDGKVDSADPGCFCPSDPYEDDPPPNFPTSPGLTGLTLGATPSGGMSGVMTVSGGTSLFGAVTMGGNLPPGGGMVELGSSNLTFASLTPCVYVPAGASRATFTISTDNKSGVKTAVTITAVHGSVVREAQLTVNPKGSTG